MEAYLNMDPCPTEVDLSALLDENIGFDRRTDLETHVESCRDCQNVLDHLTSVTSPTPTKLQDFSVLKRDHSSQVEGVSFLTRLARLSLPSTCEFSTPNPIFELPRVDGYEVLDVLGKGAMAVVYRARHLGLGRDVAIKVLHAEFRRDEVSRRRLNQEAQSLAQLRHPNIVQVYDAGESEGLPFFSLELVEGTTLHRWMNGLPQLPRLAAEIVSTLAVAVDYAHRNGILHRDLKPSNVLIATAENGDSRKMVTRLKVSDFGLAKHLNHSDSCVEPLTAHGVAVGTPQYMAPEQVLEHEGQVGPATDVYALGIILYELLTGQPPFRFDTPLKILYRVIHEFPLALSESHPHVPADLSAICAKCIEKQPKRRYQTAAHFADDLQRYLANEPIQARPISRLGRMARWARRNRTLAATLCLLAGVVITATGLITWQWWNALLARDKAEQATTAEMHLHSTAKSERDAANRARRESDRLAVELLLDQGMTACERGDVDIGLDLLVEALRKCIEGKLDDLEQTCRANLASWSERRIVTSFSLVLGSSATSVAFSPDGRRMVTGQWANVGNKEGPALAQLWDPVKGKRIGQPMTHDSSVLSVAFSPDSSKVVTGALDGSVRLWDAQTGNPLGPPLKEMRMAMAVVFSPDGKTFAATGSSLNTKTGGEARVWEVGTGKLAGPIISMSGRGNAIAYTPDNRVLMTGSHVPASKSNSDSGEVRQWEIATGQPIGPVLTHGHVVWTIACSPDGTLLVTGGNDRVATVWDRASGKRVGRPVVHAHTVLSAAFSADGRTVLTAGGNSSNQLAEVEAGASLWDVRSGQLLVPPLRHSNLIHSVAWHRDGRTIALADINGHVRVLRLCSYRPIIERQFPSPVTGLALTGDSRLLITGGTADGKNGAIATWRIDGEKTMFTSIKQSTSIDKLTLSPDGRWYALSLRNGEVRVFDSLSNELASPVMPCLSPVTGLVFTGDGQTLMTSGPDQPNRLWDWPRGKCVQEHVSYGKQPISILSPDRRMLLSGDEDGIVRFVDVTTGRLLHELTDRQHRIMSLAFRSDSRTAIAGDMGRVARFWDTATGNSIGPDLEHESGFIVWGCDFLDSRSRIYTVAGNTYQSNCYVHLWNAETGQLLKKLPHTVNIRAVALDANRHLLLTGGRYQGVRLWNTRTGRQIGPELFHPGPVLEVALSPDGLTAAASGADGTVRVWSLPSPMEGTSDEVTRRVQQLRGP